MKCLIVDRMHEKTSQLFRDVGLEVDYNPGMKRGEILQKLSDYECLVIRSKTPVDEELIEAGYNLKLVARAGAGVDNLDIDLLEKKGIKVFNAPEGNRNALAEHAVGMLLSLFHLIVKSDKEVREYIWDREGNRGVELAGKTVGLLGYGYMGQAFARKLRSFDCKVIAYDKYKEDFSDEFCEEVSIDELFERSEVFSIHVPLTSETKQMINKDFLDSFKRNIYLLNTSRGEVLSLNACSELLKKGKIKGAALDVLENEKLETLTSNQKEDFDFLIKSNKTILTPHVAGWSFESYEGISQVLATKIKEYLTETS